MQFRSMASGRIAIVRRALLAGLHSMVLGGSGGVEVWVGGIRLVVSALGELGVSRRYRWSIWLRLIGAR